MIIKIAHLYSEQLNLYGDTGNVQCLKERLLMRNIDVQVKALESGVLLEEGFDIIFIGGGQDREQGLVLKDLALKTDEILNAQIESGTVILAICGGFQLLGKYYRSQSGEKMNFTGIFDFYTIAGKDRMIGNYAFCTAEKMKIIGFENHAGKTYLGAGLQPLGRVIKGFGNNGQDKTEGLRYNNTFCTYCHGPLLPKNPRFADMLLQIALRRKYDIAVLPKLEDKEEAFARRQVEKLYI
ncbi:MAG: glutamine amidotransferase [Clostridiales bacterium]|nr:glutamine amidotransferase [Clostridiales bacterium]